MHMLLQSLPRQCHPNNNGPYFLLKTTTDMNLIFAVLLMLSAPSLAKMGTKAGDSSVEVSLTEGDGWIRSDGYLSVWWVDKKVKHKSKWEGLS